MLPVRSREVGLVSIGELRHDLPQRTAANLEGRLLPGRERPPAKEHRRGGCFIDGTRLQIVRDQSRLLQLLRRAGNSFAGYGKSPHVILKTAYMPDRVQDHREGTLDDSLKLTITMNLADHESRARGSAM